MRSIGRRSYLFYFLSFLIFFLITTFSYNIMSLLLDPYNIVWRKNPELMGNLPRYSKIEYLQKNPNKYNGFIIANSRGFFVDSTLLTELTGIHYYNMAVLADTIYGYLAKIKWLIRTQNVKHLVILLAFDQFNMGDSSYGNLLTHEHPAVNGENWLKYYLTYANLPDATFKNSLADLLHWVYYKGLLHEPYRYGNDNISDEEKHKALITGNLDLSFIGKWDDKAKKMRDEIFGTSDLAKEKDQWIATYLNSGPIAGEFSQFHDIINLLAEKKIAKTCIVVPLPARTLKLVDKDRYTQWLAYLVKECGEVWDFSDSNSVTRNKDNYLEWSHYLLPVGKLMFERITNKPSPELAKHKDFGQLINSKNIDKHIQEWRASFLT